MIDISKEAAACANWPTRERLRALQRIIPRADVEVVLKRTGKDRAHCRRLPAWFLVWFVIALGLWLSGKPSAQRGAARGVFFFRLAGENLRIMVPPW